MVAPGQLSLKVVGLNSVPTVVYVHTPVFVLLVWLPGQLIVGSSVSLIVTVKLHRDVLPDPSVAVQVTVAAPVLNTTPASVVEPLPVVNPVRTYAIVEPAQLSLKAIGLNSVPTAVYVHTPVLLGLVWLPGQVIMGNSVSFTVTVKLHEAELPDASVTVHTTLVTPLLNILPARVENPLPVVTPLNVNAIVEPGQLSLNVIGLNSVPTAVYVHAPVLVLLVRLPGQVIAGD